MPAAGTPPTIDRARSDAAPLVGGKIHHLGTDDRSSQRVRIVDAALRCIGREGLAKTTVDDIAQEAGFSRATLYRTFPGGKDAILAAVVDTETARFFSALAVAMGEAHDLEDVLVVGMTEAARRLQSHGVLNRVRCSEPGALLPYLAFSQMDQVLLRASAFAAPFFARWLEPEEAARAAEWAIRIVVAYLSCPSPGTDLSEPNLVRHVVRRFVLPGLQALSNSSQIDGTPTD